MDTIIKLFSRFKDDFAHSKKGHERSQWFIYAIVSIIIPFTTAKSSSLLRCLHFIFGFTYITSRRFYTFMASTKIPWDKLWRSLIRVIPNPDTDARLIVALDDCINPKVGKKIFACYKFFDHAAKDNQSKYPWAQNIVAAGLLKKIKGRWACMPLFFKFYQPKKAFEVKEILMGRKKLEFKNKLNQAVDMLEQIYQEFNQSILVVADSWFGNNGMWKPARNKLGEKIHILSRLRCNINLFDLPEPQSKSQRGRPRKYGGFIGKVADRALEFKSYAQSYKVDLYGKKRTVMAFEKTVMLKTIKHKVRVVWVYNRTRYVALFTTDLTLSVQEIIEYYGARWKIESGFKELKQEIGSSQTQCRDAQAVTNHLNFCMMATSIIWIYAMELGKCPKRRHAVKGRNHFAFSDVRRDLTKAIMNENFEGVCSEMPKPPRKDIITTMLRMAA